VLNTGLISLTTQETYYEDSLDQSRTLGIIPQQTFERWNHRSIQWYRTWNSYLFR